MPLCSAARMCSLSSVQWNHLSRQQIDSWWWCIIIVMQCPSNVLCIVVAIFALSVFPCPLLRGCLHILLWHQWSNSLCICEHNVRRLQYLLCLCFHVHCWDAVFTFSFDINGRTVSTFVNIMLEANNICVVWFSVHEFVLAWSPNFSWKVVENCILEFHQNVVERSWVE